MQTTKSWWFPRVLQNPSVQHLIFMGRLRASIPGLIRWSHFFLSKISLHGLHWFTKVYIRLPPDVIDSKIITGRNSVFVGGVQWNMHIYIYIYIYILECLETTWTVLINKYSSYIQLSSAPYHCYCSSRSESNFKFVWLWRRSSGEIQKMLIFMQPISNLTYYY